MQKTVLLLLLALATQAHAENILGKTTPFSSSQACQTVKCKLLDEKKLGDYILYTYTASTPSTARGEDNKDHHSGHYFAVKRGEKNVAVGVYHRNAGGAVDTYDEKFFSLETPRLARLLGLSAAGGVGEKAFSVPAGSGILLTNNGSKGYGNGQAKLVYAVQQSEAAAVARLLKSNRPATP